MRVARRLSEQVAMVRMRRADGIDDDVEQAVGAGAHVLRLGAQPQRVDADQQAGSSDGA